MLLDEPLVRGFTVPAHSHYGIAFGNKTFIIVSEIARFGSTSGRIVLRVKIKHQFLSCKIFQPDCIAILVFSRKIGSLVSNLQHDEKYLTVSEDTKILPDDKIIHIDGLTFEDWETAFYCLITMEADQKRKKEEREKLEEPTDKEKKALNAIKGALSNHIAYGFISDKYGKRAPLFRIYYYFSKGVTYKEGDYAEHLINELNSLNVREWRQTDTDTLKKYQKAFSEHLEYINALLVMRKYGG